MIALNLYKISNLFWRKNLKNTSKVIDRINLVISGNFIPGSCKIGSGSTLAYGGIGCVIHKSASIGENTVIGQGVTIGAKEAYASSEELLSPRIGNNCYIAAGARIIGNISICDGAVIGANSVVTKDVPKYAIVAGIPAKILGFNSEDFKAIRE